MPRTKQSRTKAILPPAAVVFGNGGEETSDNDTTRASRITSRTKRAVPPNRHPSGNGHANGELTAKKAVRGLNQGRLVADLCHDTDEKTGHTCQQLRELQRRKVAALKARIAIDNQLTALVATELGYSAGLEEKDRKALWTKARALIDAIADDRLVDAVGNGVASVVKATLISSKGFQEYLDGIEKEMVKLVKTLPIASWCNEVRGFGLLSLAAIIGECGNIGEYKGPAAMWKRLGLAPIQSRGVTMMPSTWRSKGGLSAEEWTEAGYSPRRRSIMFVIGECLVKQNNGEFRARYDEAKKAGKERHDDWTDGHAHNHGMLLAVKRLVKRLWQKWRGQEGDKPANWTEALNGRLPAQRKATRPLTSTAKTPSARTPKEASRSTSPSPAVPPKHKPTTKALLPKMQASAAKTHEQAAPKVGPSSRIHRLAKVSIH